MPAIGKEKRRKNEEHLFFSMENKVDVEFNEFKKGLADGTEMYDSIAKFAISRGKDKIDKEVVLAYFGNSDHIKKTVSELTEDNVELDSIFALHTLFIHLVTPVQITEVNESGNSFSGKYENGTNEIEVRDVLFLSRDKHLIEKGNKVFTHFLLFVAKCDNERLENELLDSQVSDANFMKAIRCFSQRPIEHKNAQMYLKWAKESIGKYNL
jgi:hypothetical protein